jgi:hypothetical protein
MAFFGISGSAIMARVMPTMSHMPEASTRSACSGVLTRPARITGTFTTDRVAAASSA